MEAEFDDNTFERAYCLLADLKCGDMNWRLSVSGGAIMLQATFPAPDCNTGKEVEQRGRKWYISPHMTNSEIVQTAFLAAKVAMEHELREMFKYKGKAIFGPHFSSDQLHEFASRGEEVIDARQHLHL